MYNLYIALPFENVFSITTNSHELIDCLKVNYGKYATSATDSEQITPITAVFDGSTCKIHTDAVTVDSVNPYSDITSYISINSMMSPGFYEFHGAAVEWDGHAHIFLAPTNTGKTTLIAYLIANGMKYITEDKVLIATDTKLIYPCLTPLHLREGGIQVLQKSGITFSHLLGVKNGSTDRYLFTPEKTAENPLPIGRFYFISREESGTGSIEKVDHFYATKYMLQSLLKGIKLTGKSVHDIYAISKDKCFNLSYSDMNFVMDVIKNA